VLVWSDAQNKPFGQNPAVVVGGRLKSDPNAQTLTLTDVTEIASEHHIRALAKAQGRSAGVFDIMIAAQALALGATLVTGDKASASPGWLWWIGAMFR
jgi:hypothetical protein